MEYKDYYAVLGVARDATQEEIKRAYRKLARKYHPDVSKEKDAELKFKELGEANEVLKDPEKRTAYDQLGSNWNTQQGFQPPPDWGTGFEFHGAPPGGGDQHDFSDFFESLFGQARAPGGTLIEVFICMVKIITPKFRLIWKTVLMALRVLLHCRCPKLTHKVMSSPVNGL